MTPPAPTAPAPTKLAEVLADLAGEGDSLEAMVLRLDAAGWHTPTPAEGWDIAHQVAHLAWTDEVAVMAVTDKAAWDRVVLAAIDDPSGFVDAAAAAGAAAEPAHLLARWRAARAALASTLAALPDGQKLPWFGPPMSATSMGTARFMETWAHARDVADALGIGVAEGRGLRHIVHLGVRTRNFAFATNGIAAPAEEFRVDLTAPDGSRWAYGPVDAEQSVRGAAYDFALLVTRRRNRADLDLTVTGGDADTWLDIAQAFAGPPGEGRVPRGAVSR